MNNVLQGAPENGKRSRGEATGGHVLESYDSRITDMPKK